MTAHRLGHADTDEQGFGRRAITGDDKIPAVHGGCQSLRSKGQGIQGAGIGYHGGVGRRRRAQKTAGPVGVEDHVTDKILQMEFDAPRLPRRIRLGVQDHGLDAEARIRPVGTFVRVQVLATPSQHLSENRSQ